MSKRFLQGNLASEHYDEAKINIPMSSLNVSRVFDSVPRDLRESFAEGGNALSLHLEVTFLRHG